MAGTPLLIQTHFRFRNDTGAADDAPNWAANEDTDLTWDVDKAVRLRLLIQNTGTGTITKIWELRYQKNGSGGYIGGAGIVSTQIRGCDAGSSTSPTVITTQRLTSPATGTFDDEGEYTETMASSSGSSIITLMYDEYEFALYIRSSDVVDGDFFDFRLYNKTDGTAIDSYLVTPRLTANVPSRIGQALNLGAGGSKAADQASLVLTTTEAAAAGDLVVVVIAVDNAGTGGGDEGAVSGITDSGLNSWTKLRENSPVLAANAGTVCSVWYSILANAIADGGTITAAFTNSTNRDASGIIATRWTPSAGNTFETEASPFNASVASAATAPGSLDLTTSSIECLRIRAWSFEGDIAGGEWVATIKSNSLIWQQMTLGGGSTGGSGTTNQRCGCEFFWSTGTADASSPLTGTVVSGSDFASVYVAFKEASAIAANIKTWDGLADASVKTANGLARASVKTKNGLATA